MAPSKSVLKWSIVATVAFLLTLSIVQIVMCADASAVTQFFGILFSVLIFIVGLMAIYAVFALNVKVMKLSYYLVLGLEIVELIILMLFLFLPAKEENGKKHQPPALGIIIGSVVITVLLNVLFYLMKYYITSVMNSSVYGEWDLYCCKCFEKKGEAEENTPQGGGAASTA